MKLTTYSISFQTGAESISCDSSMSLAQGKNGIAEDKEIIEDGKDIAMYQPRKRLKTEDLSDLPRTHVESFSEGGDLSFGNECQIRENHSLVQPSSEFQSTPMNKNDRTLTGKSDDTNENGDTDMHELMTGNDEMLNVESTKTDTSELQGVASSGGCCKVLPIHLGIEDQCFSTHATTRSTSCDDGTLVSKHLEELHDEAKKIINVVDGDALSEVTRSYHEEQSVSSHDDDISLDDTQAVVRETINVLVDRVFSVNMKKKLLVLDLNGLLVDISSYIPYDYDPDDIIMKKAGT